MNTPWPDPGEELPHINTQLFGILDRANFGVLQPEQSFNTPDYPNQQPTMDGFLTDYISTYTAESGRQPTYEEYAQYMTGYTPEQMPVVSGLARGFATFDHWFCEVPSCTFRLRCTVALVPLPWRKHCRHAERHHGCMQQDGDDVDVLERYVTGAPPGE